MAKAKAPKSAPVVPTTLNLVPGGVPALGVTFLLPEGWLVESSKQGAIEIARPDEKLFLFLGASAAPHHDSLADNLKRFTTGGVARVEDGWSLAEGTDDSRKYKTAVCARDEQGQRVWTRLTGGNKFYDQVLEVPAMLKKVATSLKGMKPFKP